MCDPLAQAVALLRPQAYMAKRAAGAGTWKVRRTGSGRSFCCSVLEGSCRFVHRDHAPAVLSAGDFVLATAADDYEMMSIGPVAAEDVFELPRRGSSGEFRIGRDDGGDEVRLLIAYGACASADAALLLSLLPPLVHLRQAKRPAALLELIVDELQDARPLRDGILARLMEALFLEALRAPGQTTAAGGLARGLADERVAVALKLMHGDAAAAWTVQRLAREAGMSRSAFFMRFRQHMGASPMTYLLNWRMMLAKDLLASAGETVAQVARRVGYGSANAFSVAFTRHVGVSPSVFVRQS